MPLPRTTTLVLALLSVGCGPAPPTDLFLVYDRDDLSGDYHLVTSRITTLTDVEAGRGELATVRAGGLLKLELSQPTTEEEWRDVLRIEGDRDPSIQYVIDGDTVVAWDFHSLMMITLYHHIERAIEFYELHGVARETIGRLPAYYYAKVELFLLPLPLLTDNAAYVVTLDAFLIPPRFLLDEVPLFANRGVVVHEYAHAVFNRLVFDNRRVPPYLTDGWPNAPVNELRSLDEGVADFMAAVAVGDPDFIRPSIPDDRELDRDISVDRIYDNEMSSEAFSRAPIDYDPYPLGSVVAATLWALSEGAAGVDAVISATLDALDSSHPTAAFRLTQFADGIVARLPVADQAAACQLFRERLAAAAADLEC